MIKKISLTIVAGALALTPEMANAFTGVLASCTGTVASTQATVSPGLTCANKKNTIQVKSSKQGHFNCTTTAPPATVPAGNWDTWKISGGFGSKLLTADAANIFKADVDVKGITFGSCNFGGDGPTGSSSKPFGTGTITFYDSVLSAATGYPGPGGTLVKTKNGVSKFTARIAGDIGTTSAQVVGIVTAGPGAGGSVIAQVPLSIGGLLGDPAVRLFSCNIPPASLTYCASDPFGDKGNALCTGAGTPKLECVAAGIGGINCKGAGLPYPCCSGVKTGTCVGPATVVPLETAGGFITISYDSNDDCTAALTPYNCCTGLGTGACN